MNNQELLNHFNKWKAGEMGASDFALIFLLYYHSKKYPNKNLDLYLEKQEYSKAIENLPFKKVKSKALISLKMWYEKKWNFILLDFIPSPFQVLEYQAQGKRPVTCLLQDTLRPILNRDDCLEFFLHDLEHGHMFFFDEEKKLMQLDFFQKVKKSLETNLWDDYLKQDEFKEKFYYVISDMNTHKEHYRYFLKAILPINHFKKFEHLFE